MNRLTSEEAAPTLILYTIILIVFQSAIIWQDAPFNVRWLIAALVLGGIYLRYLMQFRGARPQGAIFLYSLVSFVYGFLGAIFLLISAKVLGAVVGAAIALLHLGVLSRRFRIR